MSEDSLKLQGRLRQEFETSKNADLEICADGQVFKVNRIFLFMQSEVFKAMFDHETEEKRTNIVKIDGYDSEMVRKFLLYFYIGQIDGLDGIAYEIFKLSDYYQISDLRKQCINTMCTNLNENNFIKCFELAIQFNLDDLKQKCNEFMDKNINLNTFFKFYQFAKKECMGNLVDKIVDFIKENITDVAKSNEWQHFDVEFKFSMLQFSVEQMSLVKNDSPRQTIRLNINNFNKFVSNNKALLSNSVLISGISWNIFANVDETINNGAKTKTLGFFVRAEYGNQKIYKKWSCKVLAEFRICSQNENIATHIKTGNYIFSPKHSFWGYSQFIKCANLLDKKNGYIKNDTVCLELNFKVEDVKGIPFKMLVSKEFF